MGRLTWLQVFLVCVCLAPATARPSRADGWLVVSDTSLVWLVDKVSVSGGGDGMMANFSSLSASAWEKFFGTLTDTLTLRNGSRLSVHFMPGRCAQDVYPVAPFTATPVRGPQYTRLLAAWTVL